MNRKQKIALATFLILVVSFITIGYSYGLSFDKRGYELGNFVFFSILASLMLPIFYLKD